jgi:hypothetical protein
VLLFWAVAAKIFHAYILYPWLDIPTHFLGGIAIAYFFAGAIGQLSPSLGTTPRVVKAAAALGLTALAALVWEFLEFISDQFLGSHLNLGVTDTLSDLFYGTIGGLVYAMYSLFNFQRE